MNAIIKFQAVDIVFGDRPKDALPLMDQSLDRSTIQEQTGQVLGVSNCSLEVNQGEIVVLMGLSGSGKSTLLRSVNALTPVIRGQALVAMDDELSDFVNPQTCGAKRLRQLRRERVSMVFQQFGLLPWRTVAENVGFGLEISGLSRAEIEHRVDQQLKIVGLDQWGDRQVSELSGGMQQRVGLARAFATDAPILLMDEPFSALDPLIRNKLQDDLLALQAELQRTIIFVSHDLDEALKIGNRIAIMEGGRIIQTGTAQEIILNPKTNYVEEFVAHMNPLSVLRATEVMIAESVTHRKSMVPMAKGKPKKGEIRIVQKDTPLSDLMSILVKTETPLVIEDEDRLIGRVSMQNVVDALVRRER